MLHGPAVGAPTVVALPDGTFLMLRSQDTPVRGVLLHSDDGRTWKEVDRRGSGLDAGAIVDLAANETGAVILGRMKPMTGTGEEVADQAVWTSADGRAWSRATSTASLRAVGARDVIASSEGFAAIGEPSQTVLVSGAGGRGEWRPTEVANEPASQAVVESVARAGNGFIATGSIDARPVAWRWRAGSWSRLNLDQAQSISGVVATESRMIVAGSSEQPNPANPDVPTFVAVGRESIDGGATWSETRLPLDGMRDVTVFLMDGAFLAVLYPADLRAPLTAWLSMQPGSWEPVALGGPGPPEGLAVSSVAVSGRRVVMAGFDVGTGAGGDKVTVWVGDLAP
jgi:hypothetical protein